MKTDSKVQKKKSNTKGASSSLVLKAPLYTKEGKESLVLDLPEVIFGTPWNPDLVHQVAVAMDANARNTVAHTKDRSDVRGGGKKPWRQKATGRARHGSSRSPIWSGGGITFGPNKNRDFSKKINKKMRNKALFSLLSRKFKDGSILFVESLDFENPSTKGAKEVLGVLSKIEGFDGLETKKRNAALISFGEKNSSVEKSFRNISNIEIGESRNLNVRDMLKYKYLVVIDSLKTIDFLKTKLGENGSITGDNTL